MAPDPEGYVKLWRRLLKHPLWKSTNHNAKLLFIHILLTANWKTGQWLYENTLVDIGPGERIGSSVKIAAEVGLTRQAFRHAVSTLQNLGILSGNTNQLSLSHQDSVVSENLEIVARDATRDQGKRYTRLTLINWDRWQGSDEPEDKPQQPEMEPNRNQTATRPQPESNQTATTIKEVKKERMEEQSTSTPDSPGKSPGESPAGFVLKAPDGNSAKPKRVAKPEKVKTVRLSDRWPGWKKEAFKTLISEDPKKRYCAGSDELFDRRVTTEAQADWLIQVHREQIAECRDFEHWEGFYKWLKSAITLMDSEVSAVSASETEPKRDTVAHVPMPECPW